MRRLAWVLLFAAAAVLYSVCLDAYYVGFFNDDAFYLIGARSLLGGSFLELSHPAAPPLIQYLPGWPLLLTPAAALGGFLPARLTAAAAMLAAAGAAAWCFADDLDEDGRLMLAAVCALNPLALSLSGAVLADAPFTLALLLVLGAARRLWERADASVWFALGAAGGASFLIRPVGLAVPAALAGALAWEGRRREALCVLGGAAAAALPWLARNHALRGHALLYFSEFAAPLRPDGGAGRPLANAAHYLGDLYARTLARWPSASGASAAAALASCVGLALGAAGLRRTGLGGGRRAGVLAAALLGATLLVWEKRSGRYLLPLVPFAAAWGLTGLRAFGGGPGLRAAAVLLALASYLPPGAAIARASRRPSRPPALGPERTWAWVAANTPRDAVFGAELDGRLYLRTGRRAVTPPRDPAALGAWAARSGVGYILAEGTGEVMATASGRGAHDPLPTGALAVAAAAAGFQAVFADPAEGTVVFQAR
jgi:hypothetical protein